MGSQNSKEGKAYLSDKSPQKDSVYSSDKAVTICTRDSTQASMAQSEYVKAS